MAIHDTSALGEVRQVTPHISNREGLSLAVWDEKLAYRLGDVCLDIDNESKRGFLYQLTSLPVEADNNKGVKGLRPLKEPGYWMIFNRQTHPGYWSAGFTPTNTQIRDKINQILGVLSGIGAI